MLTYPSKPVSDEVLRKTILLNNQRVLTEEEIGHMIAEIRDQEKSGESQIVYACIRKIRISVVDVLCVTDDLRILILREDHQKIKEYQRTRTNPYSISEKSHPGEQPIETAIRGLREELSIYNARIVPLEQGVQEVRISESTGIITSSIVNRFRAVIPFYDMKSVYEEKRDGRITQLSWRVLY